MRVTLHSAVLPLIIGTFAFAPRVVAAQTSVPVTSGSCSGEPVSYGTDKTGYKKLITVIDGKDITGSYRYEKHPTGRPGVRLDPSGEGMFEFWGASSRGGPGLEIKSRWWIVADCAGAPVEIQAGPGGKAYLIVMRWTEDQPGYSREKDNFQRLTIETSGVMSILGERVKRP